jgi:hypothetical protein
MFFQLLFAIILGPLYFAGVIRKIFGLLFIFVATITTQVGGIILWPLLGVGYLLWSSKHYYKAIAVIILGYIFFGLGVLPIIAHQTGRERLPIVATKEVPLGPQNLIYVVGLRNYARLQAKEALIFAAQKTAKKYPNTIVRYMDAGFPFPYFPMLPHLTHSDGRRIDVSYLYTQDGHPVDGAISPIGYWGYVRPTPQQRSSFERRRKQCSFSLLRWDFDFIQPILPDRMLDTRRTRELFKNLAMQSKVTSLLVEPTLHQSLYSDKLKSNSCSVARHDDHFHLSVR